MATGASEQWLTPQDRITEMERRLDTLTQAVHALIDGLERNPVEDPEDDRATHGARLARELLLSRGL
jgi:hypothetical protein